MFEGDPLQMYADGHKIAIENIDDPKDIVCDGDCENCPIADIDCDGDCEGCPGCDDVDETEDVFDIEAEGLRCIICDNCGDTVCFDESRDPKDIICPGCSKPVVKSEE